MENKDGNVLTTVFWIINKWFIFKNLNKNFPQKNLLNIYYIEKYTSVRCLENRNVIKDNYLSLKRGQLIHWNRMLIWETTWKYQKQQNTMEQIKTIHADVCEEKKKYGSVPGRDKLGISP